ncbi:MAG: flagellar basal body-associated protein FliL [Bdellovibrionia bacterium]
MKQFLIILLINLGVIGFTAYMFIKKDEPPKVEAPQLSDEEKAALEAEAQKPKIPEEIYYPLDTFIVNLKSSGGQKVLKLSMEFIVENQEVFDELHQGKAQYRDLMINLLSAKTFDEIDDGEDKEKLKEEIINLLNPFLKKGTIQKVIITDIIYN